MQTAATKRIERQEQILHSLDRFGFLSRSHIQRLHRLGGDRNAQKVLKCMEEYLQSFREDEYGTVYYLNRVGRQMIGSKKIVRRTLQTKHTLMRNDYYFHMGCPVNWRNEIKVTDGKTTLVTDALFTKNKRHNFLEVDNTQSMAENSTKLKRYKEMFHRGLFQNEFGYFPTLHIVTVSRSRVRRFTELCEGLPIEVCQINDIM
ncbi:replication-relaxation family protein [Brevibacillus sp. HB1.4B]|uniref:replication-relaxation family protein n=1 Tax=Brevibacillus sp. HB1.4B TaxID=2738845 RepID=UPI001C2B7FF9|nr:replication-relaxation family protein [Brevibacillus sp. HB1.4B]